jgi:hypothetical protein
MDLVTIIKAILPVEPSRLKPHKHSLKPGDHLVGRVLKVRHDGRVIMDFSEFKALTEVPTKVWVGQTLPLEIVTTGSPVKMRIVSPKTSFVDMGKPFAPLSELKHQLSNDLNVLKAILSDSKTALVIPQKVQFALNALITFVSGVDLKSDLKPLSENIQTWIKNSGLFFENKMATAALEVRPNEQIEAAPERQQAKTSTLIHSDVKLGSLLLSEFLNKIDPDGFHMDVDVKQRLLKVLKEILTEVGRQKNLAVKRLSTEEPMQIFHLTLPLKGEKEVARLKLYYPKRQGADLQSNPRISLLLDLERLGPVRSDFLMIQRDLSIVFYVTSPKIKAHFNTKIDSIRNALEDLFETVSLVVRVSEQKIKTFADFSWQQDHDHRVDLRV